jgi:hypothetical protein
MISNCMFAIVSTILAVISYHSYWFNTFSICFFFTASLWNGANFYMEYFSRKYEENLARLTAIENQLKPEKEVVTADDWTDNKID